MRFALALEFTSFRLGGSALPTASPLSSFLALFLALGAGLAGAAFLVALPFAGAPLAALALPLAFLLAFGFAGASAALPRPWMLSQILLGGHFGGLEGCNWRYARQAVIDGDQAFLGPCAGSWVSSFWLVKDSTGLVVEAAASSAVANALMLLSVSMVNVILDLLYSAVSAVMT